MAARRHFIVLLAAISICRADTTRQDQTRADNPDSLNRHAAELEQQYRFGEAEAEFHHAADACRQTGCPFLAAILNNLGSVFHAMGRYREAETEFHRAIDAASTVGQDPSILPVALANLAAAYRAEGRFGEAAMLYDQALVLRKRDASTAAEEVPKLLTHMAGLAQQMDDLPRAEKLIREALAGFAQLGSLDSPAGTVSLVNLAAILASEGKFAEAEDADKRALSAYRQQTPGPDYAAALNSLGNVMALSQRPKEAEAYLRQAIAEWEQVLGPNHPTVASGLMSLATLLQGRRRYDEAEALMERASRIDAATFPQDHPRIALDWNNHAVLLMARKRNKEAEELLHRAAAVLDQPIHSSDPQLGQVLANLGEVYRREKRLRESRETFARGMKMLTAAWGPVDRRLLAWLDSYASVLRADEEFTEAGKLELQATRIRVIETRRRAG